MEGQIEPDKPAQPEDPFRPDKPAKPQRRPVPYDVARGAIVWLPGMRFINKKRLVQHLPAQIFDHPVLIYDRPNQNMVNAFLVCNEPQILGIIIIPCSS